MKGRVFIARTSFREFIVDLDRRKEHSYKGLPTVNLRVSPILEQVFSAQFLQFVGALPHKITNSSDISTALRYLCLYWASHLAETLAYPPADDAPSLDRPPLRIRR